MNRKRSRIPDATVATVLGRSRRRCCVCFGLRRDEKVKKGQIAHLNGNRNNNEVDNLAWICLDHHDEYDSKTSQTKSLQIKEVKAYRLELYEKYSHWGASASMNQLLRFLAETITNEDLLNGALKVASTYTAFPEGLVKHVLEESDLELMDGDLWIPHLAMLEHMQRWGLLRFTFRKLEPDYETVRFTVEHKPVCEDLLNRLKERQ